MVDRQTNALTLLLTVCNCTAISQQKLLLEKTSTRKIFKRVRDDTSSLYVQRGSTSFVSRCTDNLSKISQMFDFDRQLFISKVYEKALRGSLKDTVNNLRREQQQPYLIVTAEEKYKNKLIERDIEAHAKSLRSECTILVMGNRTCAQAFMNSIKVAHAGGFTFEDREEYRQIVVETIMRVMDCMNEVLEQKSLDLNETLKTHSKVLYREIKRIKFGDGKITSEGVGAIQTLWQDKDFMEMLLHQEVDLPDSATY